MQLIRITVTDYSRGLQSRITVTDYSPHYMQLIRIRVMIREELVLGKDSC